jgi:hypothetical protein
MNTKKLPMYYSFIKKKRKKIENNESQNIIYVEELKSYSSKEVICFFSDKPISKLFKK